MSAETEPVEIGAPRLKGLFGMPSAATTGLVIFAHGSGSGRLSSRNNYVAGALRAAGLATLLIDLLTPEEEGSRAHVFDVALLARRLRLARDWAKDQPETRLMRIGYFGASTGAGAALLAAAYDDRVAAIVSRGGRPDLAGEALERVRAPTLLLVGGRDEPVIELNQIARRRLKDCRLVVVPGATHLFEEPGALDQVVDHAKRWFHSYLAPEEIRSR